MIESHNKQKNIMPFEMAVNNFADMSAEEALENQNLYVPNSLMSGMQNPAGKKPLMYDIPRLGVPYEKNWFELGAVTIPKE